jgi:uncharacterized membrane protein YphA (DoxX/SURF4 family)
MSILDLISFILRTIVACVFIIYGIRKSQNVYAFMVKIEPYRLLSPKLNFYVAKSLPVLEVSLGVVLLFNIMSTIVVFTIGLLLIIFNIALIRLMFLTKTQVKDCGCNSNKIIL